MHALWVEHHQRHGQRLFTSGFAEEEGCQMASIKQSSKVGCIQVT